MFCPKCWKEYPKGMRTCDSCRVDLIEEKPQGMKPEPQKPSEGTGEKPGQTKPGKK